MYEELVGETIKNMEGFTKGSVEAVIQFENNTNLKFTHEFSCCEDVYLEDVDVDPRDHIGEQIVSIEEVSNDYSENYDGDERWTFYKLQTTGGFFTMRWYGTSNGWYSTRVDVQLVTGH